MKINIAISVGKFSYRVTNFKIGNRIWLYRGHSSNHFSMTFIDNGSFVGYIKDFYEIKELRQIVRNKQ